MAVVVVVVEEGTFWIIEKIEKVSIFSQKEAASGLHSSDKRDSPRFCLQHTFIFFNWKGFVKF